MVAVIIDSGLLTKEFVVKKYCIAILLLALTGAMAIQAQTIRDARAALSSVGFEASEFKTLQDFSDLTVDGKKITLADTRGKVFILNSWATWCPPCVGEMPSMQVLWDKYKSNPAFLMLGASDEKKATVNAYVKSKNFTFQISAESKSFNPYGFDYIPATFVVAASGDIVALAAGGMEWDDPAIFKAIDILLALAAKNPAPAPVTPAKSPATTPAEKIRKPVVMEPAIQASEENDIPLNVGLTDSSFLSDVEKDVIRELNLVRTDPKGYLEKIKKYRSYFKGNNVMIPGEITLATSEGLGPVDELIRELEQAKALPALKASKGLSLAAKAHVADTGPRGVTGHTGSDGSDPFKRMNRFGTWQNTAGENISYGSKTGESIVIQLLVDDGVSSRGHRKNILNSKFQVVGVSVGPHSEYDVMCVHDYAGAYKEKQQ